MPKARRQEGYEPRIAHKEKEKVMKKLLWTYDDKEEDDGGEVENNAQRRR